MNVQIANLTKKRIAFLEEHINRLVIDADVHLTNLRHLSDEPGKRYETNKYYYHGRPIGIDQLLLDMQKNEVDMCLIWQNPATTRYGADKTENYQLLLQANSDISEAAMQYPDAFIPAGWTDPIALEMEDARQLVRQCIQEFGFPFIKMNPAQNAYPINDKKVFELVSLIVTLGAIPAFHFGADSAYTPLSGLLEIADSIPDSPILVVHMGGGGAGYLEAEKLYLETRKAGLENPNLKFIQSAKRDTHMESDFIAFAEAGKPFSNNLMCGSDTPYGKMAWNFGGFRALFSNLMDSQYPDPQLKATPGLFDEQLVRQFLGGNMAGLASSAYQSILKKNTVSI